MNIALSGLVLVLLLFPGIVFRRFYYTEEFSKEYFKSTFGDLLFFAVLPSSLIHFFLLKCFVYPEMEVDFQVLGSLISGTDDTQRLENAFSNLQNYKKEIFCYFLAAMFSAVALGGSTKFIVRKFKIDRKWKLFRFQNEWHYLFSGELLDFPRIPGKADNITLRYVDALVETGKGPMIYMGILTDYLLAQDGGIDRIYLSNVRRRVLENDSGNKVIYHNLPGEFFVIPYEKILNLHVTYYQVLVNEKLDNEMQDEEEASESN